MIETKQDQMIMKLEKSYNCFKQNVLVNGIGVNRNNICFLFLLNNQFSNNSQILWEQEAATYIYTLQISG